MYASAGEWLQSYPGFSTPFLFSLKPLQYFYLLIEFCPQVFDINMEDNCFYYFYQLYVCVCLGLTQRTQ